MCEYADGFAYSHIFNTSVSKQDQGRQFAHLHIRKFAHLKNG